MNILIIDDEKDCTDVLEKFVSKLPHCNTFKAYSGIAGLEIIKHNIIDLIFSDVDMPGLNGFDLLKIIRADYKQTKLVFISGKEDIIKSINAIELGIDNFLTKPVSIYQIETIIKQIMHEDKKPFSFPYNSGMILAMSDTDQLPTSHITFPDYFRLQFGNAPFLDHTMQQILKKLNKINEYPDFPVLIQGASGSGKEIIARYIHYLGISNDTPFVAVNCSAISSELFESELFGYEKGAFTGALKSGNEGYINAASGGTLFLDEVSEIPIKSQSKLLRLIQEREYYRVGGRKLEQVTCRIILASNKNLENMVYKKKFRKDLFYRINICPIHIPSLKERPEDIVLLIFYFIHELHKKSNHSITSIEAGFIKKALAYHWPGNIRELKNIISNLVLFSEQSTLSTDSFDFKLPGKQNTPLVLPLDNFELPDHPFDLNELNKKIVMKAYKKFKGNKSKTAAFLNISRTHLYRKFDPEK